MSGGAFEQRNDCNVRIGAAEIVEFHKGGKELAEKNEDENKTQEKKEKRKRNKDEGAA